MFKVNLNPAVSFQSENVETTNLLTNAKPFIKPQEFDLFQRDDAKVKTFKSCLNNPDWEKQYLPQANIVYVKHKNLIDGLEYEVSSDGTVREVGCWIKPTVIMNPNKEMATLVADMANPTLKNDVEELKDNTTNKTKSFKESVKTKIANIWKFFSVAGTMSYASAKGVFYGLAVGAGTLLTAMVLRAPKILKAEGTNLATFYKHPFKSAGKLGTAAALATTAVTFSYHFVKGKLKANQNSSVIEHKMDVAHVND